MSRKYQLLVLMTLLVISAVLVGSVFAQDGGDIPHAQIVNDEGGAVLVTGSFPISSQNIIDGTYQALVILEDQAGFVDRDFDYVLPFESQVIAAFTSPFQVGIVTYSLALPARPQGALREVDNDEEDDAGVQIFQVALWDNRFGSAYLEVEDGHGWSGAYGTVTASIHPERLGEYTGGNLIVWAPDPEQGFPSSFGEDGLLFTEDDPLVLLPAGYTIVNMDTETFTFDRSQEVVLDLIEPEGYVPNDFSDMDYAEAFNALVDTAIKEYAYTEYKNIDWEALRTELLPRFEEADANNDNSTYLFALRDFAWSIPDGHVSVYGPQSPLDEDFLFNTNGGLGLAALELDDGRFLVSFVLPGGPADEVGIEVLAELIEFDGLSMEAAVSNATTYARPFSTMEFERVQQLRYLLVGQADTEVKLTYQNPGDSEPTTVMLTRVEEREGFGYSSIYRGVSGLEPQISYEFFDNRVGYISVTDFSNHEPLLIETWESFLRTANQIGTPAVIVDLRYNGGGFSAIGTRMASYFFTEVQPLRYVEEYNKEIDAFFHDDRFPAELTLPLDESLHYGGQIIVLVGQACASACELFAYDLALNENATVIGQYASQGIAGGWPLLDMPDGIIFALPTNRKIDFDGNIIIEGFGIEPDIRVPIDEETILRAEDDIILEAAIDYLFQSQEDAAAALQEDAVDIVLGASIEGQLTDGALRAQYFMPALDAETEIDFLAEGEFDAYLRLYISDDGALAFESPFPVRGLAIPSGLDLIVEVGSENDDLVGAFTLTVQENVPVEWHVEDGGSMTIGETVEGELSEGVRFRYTLEVAEDAVIDIVLGDADAELDTYLRVYLEDDLEEPAFENDDIDSGVEINSQLLDLEVTAGQVLIIEAAGFGDYAEGDFFLTVVESGE
jgi:C-terminal processing protease CtpA/Prc